MWQFLQRFDCALSEAMGYWNHRCDKQWLDLTPITCRCLIIVVTYDEPAVLCQMFYWLHSQGTAINSIITTKAEALYFSIPCSINPFICFRDSNCSGLSGATVDAAVDVEFNEPWLPPNDLSSELRLRRSSGRLIRSPVSSPSASVKLPFLFTPGVGVSVTLAG